MLRGESSTGEMVAEVHNTMVGSLDTDWLGIRGALLIMAGWVVSGLSLH